MNGNPRARLFDRDVLVEGAQVLGQAASRAVEVVRPTAACS